MPTLFTCVLACVAFTAKHQDVLWRVKLTPFAVSDVMRLNLCFRSAFFAQAT